MAAGAESAERPLEQDDERTLATSPSPGVIATGYAPIEELVESPAPPSSQPARVERLARLGGARAEFAAHLGRRVGELTSVLGMLEQEPSSARLRDDLRRRIHALATGARLLRFTRLSEELTATEQRLETLAREGSLARASLGEVRETLERAPGLAWQGDEGTRSIELSASVMPPPVSTTSSPTSLTSPTGAPGEAPQSAASKAWRGPAPTPSPATPSLGPTQGSRAAQLGTPNVTAPSVSAPPSPTVALTTLVVGSAGMGRMLTGTGDPSTSDFEVEETLDATTAIDLTRALAPDVIVLDASLPGAEALCRTLADDPLTESTPIVVVGSFERPQDSAAFVASGVARVLTTPVSPDQLRRAVLQAASTYVRREVHREPLGEVTLDELGAKLAEELRRGLCDAAEARHRNVRVELGDGHAVLAALWSAVARVRELVTIESKGNVRFAPSGPEGALPLALGESRDPRGRGPATPRTGGELALDVKLEGMTALVADDDPAVCWFLSGLLRSRGVRVFEATDGARALSLATAVMPDLVLTDILMPHVDGFSLCRTLRRDVVLRDVPIILLSWKEDLLARVRELGADADGYLKKESSGALIEQRVRELLRPRARVAQRLATPGEVRGRLDGMTAHALLGLVAKTRPTSILTVRDAVFLYEIELSEGRPVRASRTDVRGSFERGPGVLAGLLGVGAGRFSVIDPEPSPLSVEPELVGSLDEQLRPLVARARGAQRLLAGAEIVRASEVGFDKARLRPYLDTSPEPARSLLARLAVGSSPSDMVSRGEISPRLFEDVLADVAARGLVTRVLDTSGVDRLPDAVAEELELLVTKGASALRRLDALPTLTTRAAPGGELDALFEPSALPPELDLAPGEPASDRASAAPSPVTDEAEARLLDDADVLADPSVAPPAVASAQGAAPSKLARAPEEPLEPSAPAPVVASSGRVRTLEPPLVPKLVSLGSLSPPPVIESAPSTPEPSGALESAVERPSRAQGSSTNAASDHSSAGDRSPRAPERKRVEPRVEEPTPTPRRVRGPSAYAPPPPPQASKTRPLLWVVAAAAGLVFAVGARMARDRDLRPVAPAAAADTAQPAALDTAAPAQEPPTAAEPAPAQAAPNEPTLADPGDTAESPVLPTDIVPKPEDKVPAGHGQLELAGGPHDVFVVDGKEVGKGPLARVALPPKKGAYEVRVKQHDRVRVRYASVREGRVTRLRVAPPWQR
jgi:CheY-like chemotaxis protein/HPt (histidine-containing phosphotransfer) domain-containing protein